MAIKNLMEDIVTSVVNEVLSKEAKDILESEPYKQDIIAYVLNRVPAKYFTSERGILHERLESRFTFQQKTDILLFTHEAIRIMKYRRASEIQTEYTNLSSRTHYLPYIIGEVFEETTFSIISDLKVLLLYKESPAKMMDKSWKNPYITSKATQGYYHFWPEFTEGEMNTDTEIPFTLVFNHPNFTEKRFELTLKVMDTFNLYKSKSVPITLLQTLAGIDISFLYE